MRYEDEVPAKIRALTKEEHLVVGFFGLDFLALEFFDGGSNELLGTGVGFGAKEVDGSDNVPKGTGPTEGVETLASGSLTLQEEGFKVGGSLWSCLWNTLVVDVTSQHIVGFSQTCHTILMVALLTY